MATELTPDETDTWNGRLHDGHHKTVHMQRVQLKRDAYFRVDKIAVSVY